MRDRRKAKVAAGFVLCLTTGVAAGFALDALTWGTLAGLVVGLGVERHYIKGRNNQNS